MSYSYQFRLKIIKLATEQEYSIREVAKLHNIPRSAVIYWLKAFRERGLDGVKLPHTNSDSASVHTCAFFILVTGTSVDACAIGGDNLKRFEPPLKIQGFTKTLIWHERTHKDPAYRWVRELIEKACLVDGK